MYHFCHFWSSKVVYLPIVILFVGVKRHCGAFCEMTASFCVRPRVIWWQSYALNGVRRARADGVARRRARADQYRRRHASGAGSSSAAEDRGTDPAHLGNAF